jgi:hypothetical protein
MLFHYWVWLRDRRGNPYIFEDIVPWVISQSKIEQTYDQFVEKLGVCKNCDGHISHVIEKETGRKFCPVLFHDLIEPKWRLEKVV